VKEAVIALGRRGGIRGRELAAALGARPISSHKTILIASGAESVDGKLSAAKFL
jgi:hypothetical protein